MKVFAFDGGTIVTMGRAQNNRAIVVNNFNTVIGRRRGSLSAQTQRDASERQDSLTKELEAWVEAKHLRINHPSTVIDSLISAYVMGVNTPEAEGYSQLVAQLLDAAEDDTCFADLVFVAAAGDSEEWPSWSMSAVTALAAYFENMPVRAAASVVVERVRIVLDQCFRAWDGVEQFERLQPLCDALADAQLLGLRAISVLRYAPIEAVAGPLQSWIEALARISAAGALTAAERTELTRVVVERSIGLGEQAFAPLRAQGLL